MTRELSLRMVFSLLFQDTLFRDVRGTVAPRYRPGYAHHPSSYGGGRVLGGTRGPGRGSQSSRRGRGGGARGEDELNDTGEIESAWCRKLVAPPPYTELSGFFGPLEQLAQSAGNTEVGHFLRKAKMSFLAAHAAKPVRQADMRMLLES